jgi:hypothetical protein
MSTDPTPPEPEVKTPDVTTETVRTAASWFLSSSTSPFDVAIRAKLFLFACLMAVVYVLAQTPGFIYRYGVAKPYQLIKKATVSKATLLAQAEKEFKTHAWKLENFDGQLIVLKRRTKEAFQQGNKELARNLAISYRKLDQRRQTFLAAYSDAFQTMSAYQAIQDMEYLSASLKVTANIAKTLDISSDRVTALADKIESQLSIDAREELKDDLERAGDRVLGYNDEMEASENRRNQMDEIDDFIMKEIMGMGEEEEKEKDDEQKEERETHKVKQRKNTREQTSITIIPEENAMDEQLSRDFMRSFALV